MQTSVKAIDNIQTGSIHSIYFSPFGVNLCTLIIAITLIHINASRIIQMLNPRLLEILYRVILSTYAHANSIASYLRLIKLLNIIASKMTHIPNDNIIFDKVFKDLQSCRERNFSLFKEIPTVENVSIKYLN